MSSFDRRQLDVTRIKIIAICQLIFCIPDSYGNLFYEPIRDNRVVFILHCMSEGIYVAAFTLDCSIIAHTCIVNKNNEI